MRHLRRLHSQGQKPADLPVQLPSKYALGDQPQDCEMPPTLLTRADEVIE
jgi:hypothetical protein